MAARVPEGDTEPVSSLCDSLRKADLLLRWGRDNLEFPPVNTALAEADALGEPISGGVKMAVDFYIKEGDTAPPIVAILKDAEEDVVVLTGATVRFIMNDKLSGTNVVDAAGTVVDSDNGVVAYEWQTGDTDTPGVYNGEFEVSWPDGTYETFPNWKHISIKIKADLGGTVPA